MGSFIIIINQLIKSNYLSGGTGVNCMLYPL